MTKLVYGVGVNDRKYPAVVEGKTSKEYHLWNGLLERCYNPKTQERYPTYLGCSASVGFQNFSFFSEWCQNQIGFGQKGFHLDKDLIFKGNKLYSEDTCLFIPSQLNRLLISNGACRGSLPIGVSAQGSKFRVYCNRGSSPRYMGYCNTIEEAHNTYKEVKEVFIKSQAEKWKAHIDPRAFAALMAYEVSISD